MHTGSVTVVPDDDEALDSSDLATVPFVDLKLQHRRIAGEVGPALERVMDSTSFVLGPEVAAFEREYAEFCDVRHCVGVANGTDAIELALRAAGVGPGEEVIIPANTFVATAEAVLRAGASLVLADCGDGFLLDSADVAERVTKRTRAVIAVDLYGQIAQMERIAAAVGPSVLLFEDAAQSQGATRFGRPAGSFGAAAATSFYPGKNLGAYGDAGAVLSHNPELADRVRALRSHGGHQRYEHSYIGTNSRLDSMQACVLSIKLRHLRAWNAERQTAAEVYTQLLSDTDGIELPQTLAGNEHVWHLYVITVPDRDRVLGRLNAAGIAAGLHYPAPIHRLPAYREIDFGSASYPRSDSLASRILSLPIFPGITVGQQERVVSELERALQGRRL